jgi:membrane protease YdiL (CAAX protease family)
MNRPFAAFLFCEIAYVISVRLLLGHFAGHWSWQVELYVSCVRFVSIAALIWLFRQREPGKSERNTSVPPQCLWAAGIFLAPILAGEMNFQGADRYLFAATSIIVGVREELAYRGIAQGFLARKFGLLPGLLISNLMFVGYHWGIQPFTLHYVLQIFLCGMIFGFVYYISGSIILAIALHTIYDAIDSFTPYFVPRLPDYVCTIVGVATLAALVIANSKSKTASGMKQIAVTTPPA